MRAKCWFRADPRHQWRTRFKDCRYGSTLRAGRRHHGADGEPTVVSYQWSGLRERRTRSAAPMQLYRAVHWVLRRHAALGESRRACLSAKYHLAGLSASSISIRLGIVAQALGLLDHRDLVLAHKLRAEEFGDGRDKGHVVEDVPRGDDVDAAGGSGDRRDGGEA